MRGKTPAIIAIVFGLGNGIYFFEPLFRARYQRQVTEQEYEEKGKELHLAIKFPPTNVSRSAHPLDSAKALEAPLARNRLATRASGDGEQMHVDEGGVGRDIRISRNWYDRMKFW